MAKGNFKVRALKTHDDFTKEGKIYEFINGQTTWECGKSCFYDNFEEFITRNQSFYGNVELFLGDEEMGNITFKMRALSTDQGFYTKDRVYVFVDGVTTWDNGRKSAVYKDFIDFIASNRVLKDSFKEIDKLKETKFTKEEIEAMSLLISYGVDKLKEVIGLSEGILEKMKKLEG